jgi:hypothetical protein
MADDKMGGDRSPSLSLDKDVKVMSDGVQTVTSTGESKRMSASVAIDPAAENRLVWKFDLRILPTLAVMYLFNSLDKSMIHFNLEPLNTATDTNRQLGKCQNGGS